jgi:hypothetical protein
MTDMAQLATLIGPIFVPMEKRCAGRDKQGDGHNDDQV